ncbi:hypothetical protein [Ruminococcus flavefaciens]|uniref:hypothetical protein n=1 Tax=Ruminococcus flavefaciens TaxID=1265 RepID=UPI003EFD457D
MIEGLAVFCISGCIGLELYCGVRLKRILRIRSEERTDNRRAYYRDKAYKTKAEARALKDARQELWRRLQK